MLTSSVVHDSSMHTQRCSNSWCSRLQHAAWCEVNTQRCKLTVWLSCCWHWLPVHNINTNKHEAGCARCFAASSKPPPTPRRWAGWCRCACHVTEQCCGCWENNPLPSLFLDLLCECGVSVRVPFQPFCCRWCWGPCLCVCDARTFINGGCVCSEIEKRI